MAFSASMKRHTVLLRDLLREEGRGFYRDLVRLLDLDRLPAQAPKLVALIAGQRAGGPSLTPSSRATARGGHFTKSFRASAMACRGTRRSSATLAPDPGGWGLQPDTAQAGFPATLV